MALNTFERLATVIHPADLTEIAGRKKRLAQFLQLCGSSPFLVNLIFKTPDAFRWLFLENGIDLSPISRRHAGRTAQADRRA